MVSPSSVVNKWGICAFIGMDDVQKIVRMMMCRKISIIVFLLILRFSDWLLIVLVTFVISVAKVVKRNGITKAFLEKESIKCIKIVKLCFFCAY